MRRIFTRRVTLVLVIGVTLLVAAILGVGSLAGEGQPDAAPVPPSQARVTTPAASIPPVRTPVDQYRGSAVGYAISWPQCGQLLPDDVKDFGIVGVTGGWPFVLNPCLAKEFAWARRAKGYAAFYMNTNYAPEANPEIAKAIGEACGQRGGACEAYFYGIQAAEHAFVSASEVRAWAPMWWLDVQITSTWSADPAMNALVIQGAIDDLRSHDVRVGISSTPFQWQSVVGNYSPALPGWVAGASDVDEAARFCDGRQDFGGGRTEQIAYVDGGFEMVRAC